MTKSPRQDDEGRAADDATSQAGTVGARRPGPTAGLNGERPEEANEGVCLDTPAEFFAVGQFYRQFLQVQKADVTELFERDRARRD